MNCLCQPNFDFRCCCRPLDDYRRLKKDERGMMNDFRKCPMRCKTTIKKWKMICDDRDLTQSERFTYLRRLVKVYKLTKEDFVNMLLILADERGKQAREEERSKKRKEYLERSQRRYRIDWSTCRREDEIINEESRPMFDVPNDEEFTLDIYEEFPIHISSFGGENNQSLRYTLND